MEFEKITNTILAVDNAVRYVGIVGGKGKLMYSKLKEGRQSLKTPQQEEVFASELSVMKLMQELYNDSLGKVTFTHTVREKIHQMIYFIDNIIIYVSCERNTDNQKILEISDRIESIIG